MPACRNIKQPLWQHRWFPPAPCALKALIKTAWDLHNVIEPEHDFSLWPSTGIVLLILFYFLCIMLWYSSNWDRNETLRMSSCCPNTFLLAVYEMALVAALLFLLPVSWACAPQKAGSYQTIKNISIKVSHFNRTTTVLQFDIHCRCFFFFFFKIMSWFPASQMPSLQMCPSALMDGK